MSTSRKPGAALYRQLFSTVGKRFGLSMVAAVVTRLGLLLLAIIVGRSLGPQQYGAFTFATSMALLSGQLAAFGWPRLTNRLVPEMMRDRAWPELRGLFFASDVLVLGASLVLAIGFSAFSFASGELSESLALSAWLIFPIAIGVLRRQQLASLRRPAAGLFFDQGFGALAAVAVLLAIPFASLEQVIVLFAGTMLAGSVYTTLMVRRLLPREALSAPRKVRLGPWLKIAVPMMVSLLATLLRNKADVLMLAPLAGLLESGLYGAAFRITFLLTFPQVVLMSVLTPLISEAFANGKPDRVRRLILGGTGFALCTALPFAAVLALFPEPVLAFLFGEEFRPAAGSLVLLAIGQLLTSLAIPLQAALMMGGREKAFSVLSLATLGLQVALNLVLIPPYGAVGAAISTMLASAFALLAQIWLDRALLFRK